MDPSMAGALGQKPCQTAGSRRDVRMAHFEYQALTPEPVWVRAPVLKWKSLPAACRHGAGILAVTVPAAAGIMALMKSITAASEPIVQAASTVAVKTITIPLDINVNAGDGPIRIARHVLGDGSRWKELFQYFPQWGTPDHFVIHPGVAHGIATVSQVSSPTIVMQQIPIPWFERLWLHPPDLLVVVLGAVALVGAGIWLAHRLLPSKEKMAATVASISRRALRWGLVGILSTGVMNDIGRRLPPFPAAAPFVAASSHPVVTPMAREKESIPRRFVPPPHVTVPVAAIEILEPPEIAAIDAASVPMPSPDSVLGHLDFIRASSMVAAKAADAAVETIGIDLDQDPEEGPDGKPRSVWLELLPIEKEIGIEAKFAGEKDGATTTLEARLGVSDERPSGGTIGDAITGPSVETQWAFEHHSSGQIFSEVARLGAAADTSGNHEAQVFAGLSSEKTDKRKHTFVKEFAGFVFGEEDGALAAGPAAFTESGVRVGPRGAVSASAGFAPRTGPFVKANAQLRVLNGHNVGLTIFGRFVLGQSVLIHLHGGPAVGVRLIVPQPPFFHKRSDRPRRRLVIVAAVSLLKATFPDFGAGLEPLDQRPPKSSFSDKKTKKQSRRLKRAA